MSPKSEENIKKETNVKVNLKVSRKKNKPSTENISYAKISSLKPINKKLVDIEKLSIHSVEKPEKNNKPEKKTKKNDVVSEVEEDIQKSAKKTLKLNINRFSPEPVQKRTFTPDTTINQNSSFFYSQSVFQRYGINITNISDENTESTPSDEVEPVKEKEVAEPQNNIEVQENQIEAISSNEISEDLLESISDDEMLELISSDEELSEPSLDVAADSIEPVEPKKSSIPSNASSVFKVFSYEEADLANMEKQILPSNNEIQEPLKYTTTPAMPQSTFSNEISIDMNSIDFEDIPSTPLVPNIAEAPIVENISYDTKSVQAPVNTIVKNEIKTDLGTTVDEDVLDSNNTPIVDDDLEENNEQEPEVDEENTEEVPSESNDSMFDIKTDIKPLDDENIDYSKIDYHDDDESNDDFSIEDYFGLNDIKPKEKVVSDKKEKKKKPLLKEFEELNEDIDNDLGNKNDKKSIDLSESEFTSLSNLFDSFTEKISSLSNRISELENKPEATQDDGNEETVETEVTEAPVDEKVEVIETPTNENVEEVDKNYIDNFIEQNSGLLEELEEDDNSKKEDADIDIDIDDISLEDLDITENDIIESVTNEEENNKVNKSEIEGILTKTFSDDNSDFDDLMKEELLNEVLLTNKEDFDIEPKEEKEVDTTDDFFTIIDTLTKTITKLEGSENLVPVGDGKSINILIDKDDIFSISILNETYEIVADFDGISVLSENIHISTPKKNFYVTVGSKYIEIHNNGKDFSVNTNFEDIEFANALNNVTFAKKNNIIELSIKEAFKLSSVNNKVELSMLNKSIAEIKKSNVETVEASETVNESSICDNRTLLISEETQKVYLPYTIEELMQKLNDSNEYQTLEEVVEKEYTVPLSTFKMPIISRFKEAYRFMRTKEHSSVYAALDLAVELMFNSNLNPAVIRAAKDLKELNVYLDCLYENEIEKFDCFKIVYKVLPKIQ